MPRYRLKPIEVEAIQLKGKMVLVDDEGVQIAEGMKGDWLITNDEGQQFIMQDDEFQKLYEVVAPKQMPHFSQGDVTPTRDIQATPLPYYPNGGPAVEQIIQEAPPARTELSEDGKYVALPPPINLGIPRSVE